MDVNEGGRRVLILSDLAWEWLLEGAKGAGLWYKGRPSRTAYLELLASGEIGAPGEAANQSRQEAPVVPAPLSFKEAWARLSEYQQGQINGYPGGMAALQTFYDAVVGG